jgi:hypothetical protein
MASTFSTDLALELMATGENAGTWGDKTNSNLNLVQQAIAGYEAIALSDGGTVTLAMTMLLCQMQEIWFLNLLEH